MSVDNQIKNLFPRLQNSEFKIASPEDNAYNCIAWAAGINDISWWPISWHDYYWPKGIPLEDSVEAFMAAFESLGFKVCEDYEFEEGYEKIAIFAIGNKTKHAARQLESGLWTSKLGDSFDIEHKLFDLTGKIYGEVVRILKRKRNDSS